LERIHIAKAELNMCIDDKLGEPENLATQMERIAKTGFLPFLGGQRPMETIYWKKLKR
jgi:hypothetical protein